MFDLDLLLNNLKLYEYVVSICLTKSYIMFKYPTNNLIIMDNITVRLEKEIAKSLKDIKLTRLETYDEIIMRLLQEHNKNEEQDKNGRK